MGNDGATPPRRPRTSARPASAQVAEPAAGEPVLRRRTDSVPDFEELARDHADLLRSFMEQAPFSVQVFSPDGRTIHVNRAFEELWGVRLEQMTGYNILEDRQLESLGTLEYIRRGFAGETLRLPAVQFDPNASVPGVSSAGDPRRWLAAVIFPLRDGRGRIREVVIVHEDITARVRAEEERSRSEQQTRNVLESITDAFFAVGRDWLFTYVNPQAERLLGTGLIGGNIWSEFPGLAGHVFEEVFRGVMAEREKRSVTAFYPDHGRWYEGEIYPAAGGGISCFFRDVSDRKSADAVLANAEKALRESVRVYRAIGESIDYGIWICDPAGNATYHSDSFLRMIGMSAEEAAGAGWMRAVHPDDLAVIRAAWRASRSTGLQWDQELRFRGTDGRWHPILARGVPIRSDDGEIAAWAGINLDIGRLKQVEVELREADRRKDEFLATLAHELRNPLAPIRNSLEILNMPRVDVATARQTREMMERQVHHLVRLVDDLLDVSRVMRGKIELRRERVELATIVSRAVETAKPLIDSHGHRLELDLPPESLALEADPVRLTQVVGNLLTNAAKYTEPGGSIWVGARAESDSVVLRVRDNGIGIDPEMLPRIFDLFVQVDHDSSRLQSGLGIGLTLVEKLVAMHAGSVVARSEGLGKGCELLVRLPLAPREERESTAADEDTRPEGNVRPSGLRLLIVDDNGDAAQSLAMLLRLHGHDARIANDGPSAIEIATEYAPNLVFLDIGMPGMDGYEVARRMRQLPGLERVVLAALTGWGQKEDRRRTAEAGFDHHLVKPVDLDLLHDLLAGLSVRTPA